MWKVLDFLFNYLGTVLDGKLATIMTNQEKLMSKTDDALSKIAVLEENLANSRGDVQTLMGLVATGNADIATLQATIVQLQGQVGDSAGMDAVNTALDVAVQHSADNANLYPETAPPTPTPTPDVPPAA